MTPALVLVIDDNPLNLKLTRLVLEQRGFAVQTAGDAMEALTMLQTSAPALILMDLQLPDMDGFQLASVIKANPETRHIPVIALTAYAMKGDDRRALDAGCDDYIAKPIDTRTLADRVAHVLAQAERRGIDLIMTDTRIRRSVVLVVDDEPVNVALLKRLVVRAGHDARSADDGRAALAAIDADPPDLILLDIQMPGLGGFEVCRIVKTNPATRLIPIVLITGLNDRESRIEGINAGADDFLTKPFDVGELTARLRSLLRLKQYTDDLDSAESVILSLALTVEARDPYTQGHCQRLASYATTLGEALQLPVEQLAALHRGGYLHDVGKIGIPDSILLKPGALTEEEFALMKEHTTIGERLCGNLRSLISVRSIVRSHHERLDGSGYPDGLRGEEIPLLAQIVSLADIYDAITTTRPYRVASPPDYAYAEILREAERGARSMKLAELFVSLGRGGQLAAGVAASGSPVG